VFAPVSNFDAIVNVLCNLLPYLAGLVNPQNTKDCSTFWLRVTQVPEKHNPYLTRQTSKNPRILTGSEAMGG